MYIRNAIIFVGMIILYLVMYFKTIIGLFLMLLGAMNVVVPLMVLLLAYFIVAPIVFYRRYSYIVSSDRVDVRRGVLIVHHILVPLERVHQVEIRINPISGRLGFADVIMTTAGGTAKIQFLEKDVANRIAAELNVLINDMIRDRRRNDRPPYQE